MKTDWFFDADGTGTAFYAWKAWPVVRQACPNRRFLEPRRSASCERVETAFVWGMDAERAENMAALEIAKRPEAGGKNFVVLLPDSGDRYLTSKLFAE